LQVEGVGGGGELGGVWEFPRSRLRLQTVLGEGNFGKVRKGVPKNPTQASNSRGRGQLWKGKEEIYKDPGSDFKQSCGRAALAR
jgi:hypothetical protein